ncbi:hypothetical protein HYW74_01845 [Candidatus Pacearchaeota archaeon]|nr:hypothetical protein [Candidatus Pacearchaeota archaeon]
MELNRGDNLNLQKDRIMQFLEIRGPSLPVHIATHIKLSPLIASAFLADLLSDKQIKISSLRVGNSPVYFLRGQEFQLDRFANYLSGKEKEIFYLLKENQILQDNKVPPAARVALRNIKDFAFPFEHNGELYWRYIKTSEQMAIEIIEQGKILVQNVPKVQKPREIIAVQEIIAQPVKSAEILEVKQAVERVKEIEPIFEIKEEKAEEKLDLEKPVGIREAEKPKIKRVRKYKTLKIKVKEKPEFVLNVLKLMEENKILVLENEKFKKKDYSAVVSIEGKNYLSIAKEKKAITENDLASAMKLGQKLKLPLAFISTGEPNKKALDLLEYYKGMILFKKIF